MDKIEKKLRRKKNPELVETIILLKKNKAWKKIANLLSRTKRKQIKANLDEIDKKAEEGDTIIVPGKVLGVGKLTKKLVIVAFSFSQRAREKLKGKVRTIKEEIKNNPKAEGIKVLK